MRHSNSSPIARENEVKAPHLDFISIINVLLLVVLSFFYLNRKEKGHVNKEGTGQRLDRNPAN